MPWHRTGSVAVTAGQTTVAGTSTSFALNARVGDAFQGPDGRWYEVANIASATVLSILPAYQGATVTAGAYGIAPMQGYVKEAADRLRQLVDQFGGTLALLGNPADIVGLRANIGAATRGANSDISSLTGLTTALSVTQGGTGGKTQAEARSGLGLKSAAVADIVGTVSQAGGIPSGAVIERGSNSNGQYVKFADGSIFASTEVPAESMAAGSFRGYTWSFPVAFGWSPVVLPTATLNFSNANGPVSAYADHGSQHTFSSTRIIIRNSDAITQSVGARIFAIGRWY